MRHYALAILIIARVGSPVKAELAKTGYKDWENRLAGDVPFNQ